MDFPISFLDFSIWIAIATIVLMITFELLSPRYSSVNILINRKKFRLLVKTLFTLTMFIISLWTLEAFL